MRSQEGFLDVVVSTLRYSLLSCAQTLFYFEEPATEYRSDSFFSFEAMATEMHADSFATETPATELRPESIIPETPATNFRMYSVFLLVLLV